MLGCFSEMKSRQMSTGFKFASVMQAAKDPFYKMLLRHTGWFIGLFQAALIFLSLVFAWLLRFDFSLPDRPLLISAAPILILLRLGSLGACGAFHGWWKYTGVSDVIDLLKGIALGSAAFVVSMRFVFAESAFPRSIYFLEPLVTLMLLAGVRFFSRALFDSVRQDERSSKRVALIGAGVAGQMILRELRQPHSHCLAVACVDDDSSKHGLKIQGVPVMGTIAELPLVLSKNPVDEVLIAVPSATAVQMRRFVAVCKEAGVKCRTVPSLREIIAGEVSVNQIRDVNVEDLLGREPVQLHLEAVLPRFRNKCVLVTGAAGSIGSELCRQLLACHPRRLICADRNETGMFYLHRELESRCTDVRARFCVTDVSNADEISRLCENERPEVIFHAAAYKHVSLMQNCSREAIRNNVFALLTLLDAAGQNGCDSFVFISSDKAVRPTSVMGATKRVGELILSSRPAENMRCISVRFGNVLGSNGSVVPIFQQQIRTGSALTITHPDVCRFFMTIHEAASLVLQAFAIGRHGEILVLDMDRPVCILDLAKALIRLSGKSLSEIEIRFSGLRPGEKLREELFYDYESIVPTSHPKVQNACGLAVDWGLLQFQLTKLKSAVSVESDAAICARLHAIVAAHSSPQCSRESQPSDETGEPVLFGRAARV